MKAMIFAAGLGTRLKPLTDTRPKALVELNGQTLLQRLMLKLHMSGISEVVINVHHFPDMIIDYLKANNGFGLKWQISDERNQLLETGGGLKKAESLLEGNEPILVHNVDILSNLDFRQLIADHSSDRLATLVVSQRQTQRYFLFDDTMRLCGWTNKATGETRMPDDMPCDNRTFNELAFSGIQIVSPLIFNTMNDFGDRFSITELYIQKCGTHLIKGFVPQDYKMMDVGKINQIEEAQSFAERLV